MSDRYPPGSYPEDVAAGRAGPRPAIPGQTAQLLYPAQGASRRHQAATTGGLVAGLGIGIALACLIKAIEQTNPSATYTSFGWTLILVVVVAGPAIGLGLTSAIGALIPDDRPMTAAPPPDPEPGPRGTPSR
jgi:hypothetical protein